MDFSILLPVFQLPSDFSVAPVSYLFYTGSSDSELCCIYMLLEIVCCACNVLLFSLFNKNTLHIQQVENLRDQLQKERNLRASLESGLMNMRRGQVSFPSTIDTKVPFLNLAIEIDNGFRHLKLFSFLFVDNRLRQILRKLLLLKLIL